MGQGSSVACKSLVEDGEWYWQQRMLQVPDLSLEVPEECLELIFAKLNARDRNHCSLVCKRWHHLEGRSRKQLSLLAQAELLPSLPSLLHRFSQITKLTLRCDKKEPSVEDKALVSIAKQCKHLTKLKLKGCKDLSDDGLIIFSQLCVSLKKFSCSSCGFGPSGLNSLLRQSTLLETLTVKRLKGLGVVTQGVPELIGPGNCNLKRLCLKELRNARLFGPLIVASKNLLSLRLAKNFGHWDKLLELIMEHLPGLVELHMEKMQLSDRGLQAVAQCKNLESLYVVKASECTNFGLSAISFGCKHLRKLRLDGWRSSRIGDEGLISIAKRCRDLQELVLIRLDVTVGSMSLVASNCCKLERLAICNSETFGDAELTCLATKCRNLKKLCIRTCPISNLGLDVFSCGCPALTRLKVRNCVGVTAAGVASLQAKRGKQLWISLINDFTVSDSEAQQLGSIQGANNRIHRVLQGGSQLVKSRINLSSSAQAVSCGCTRWSAPNGP